MRNLTISAVCLLALLTLGCAGEDMGPTGTLKGKIIVPADWTFPGGDSCAGSKVIFVCPDTGYGAVGICDAEGNFVLEYKTQKKIPIGLYDVSIQGPDNRTQEELDVYKAAPPGEKQALDDERNRINGGIPPKYRTSTTSEMTYEVKEENHEWEITIEGEQEL